MTHEEVTLMSSSNDKAPPPVIRGVSLAAKSTDDVKGSNPDQLRDCRAVAKQRGIELVAEYADEGVSAYHANRGPQTAAAMAHCERLSAEHGKSALIVQHSDRLARGDAKEARHLVEIVLWAIKNDVELLSVQDPEILAGGDLALLLGAIGGMRNHQDSKRKGLAVRDGARRRKERGQHHGGNRPTGYTFDPDAPGGLTKHPAEAATVDRIYLDTIAGVSQRALARALNSAGIPTATGSQWTQGGIARILRSPLYKGWLTDTQKGKHKAIVDERTWERAQHAKRSPNRRGGNHPDGAHLLVNGVFRCLCGEAMIPRKGRPGGGRDRYECRGRVQHGPRFCDQPSIRRELVDEPLLSGLLDHYIDLDATRARLAARLSTVLADTERAMCDSDREVAAVQSRMAKVTRGWQDEVIPDGEYMRQRSELEEERRGAEEALRRAQGRLREVSASGAVRDAEEMLRRHVAVVQAAVSEGVHGANLDALRTVIGQMFRSIALMRGFCFPAGGVASGGFIDSDVGPDVGDGYWLMPVLRWSAVDDGTFRPVRQELPQPMTLPSDNHGFFSRYCWW